MKKSLKNILFYLIIVAVVIVTVVMIVRNSAPKVNTLDNYSDLIRLISYPNEFVEDYFNKDKNTSQTPISVPDETAAEGETLPAETQPADTTGKYSVSEIKIGNDNVITVVCSVTDSLGKTTSKTFQYKFANEAIVYEDLGGKFVELILADGSTVKVDYVPTPTYSVLLRYLPIIIIIVGFIILYFVAMRKAMNGGDGARMNSFGKAKVKTAQTNKDRVLFSDVAGADEEKEELQEVVDFLRDPAKFTRLGAKIPRGVLLVGPPGTGKTLLAKAVAGEAGVPFLSISGSDFVEMYVGVGASRVRDLFETARKAPASIIFIDEIDAVGRHRGAGLGGGHDEREQTLNQLLVEMDGFGTNDGVIVIAATNRPDILDPALLRPGRFDRQITVNVPDIKGREEILRVHIRKKPLEPDVDLREIAKTTAGFTGADLANLLNEAALLAARRGKSLIGMDDISDAFIKVVAGPKKRSMHIKDDDKRKTAYHEAGHAMIAYLLNLDPVQQISIIPSGSALGYTLNPPADDKYSVYKNELQAQISMLLAGRAAEQIVCGDISGGASNDIQRATKIAKRMVTQLGMSDVLGPRCFGSGQEEIFLGREISSTPDYSNETAAKIDAEVHRIITEAFNKAVNLLTENIEKLHFLAGCLVRFEILDGDQFKAAMEKDGVTEDDILAISEEKKAKSEEANKRRQEQKKAEEQDKPTPSSSDFYATGNSDYEPDDSDKNK